MDALELARLVKRCREHQRRYFRERTPQLLAECRDLERRVDRAVAEVLDPPAADLFTDVGGEGG